MLSFRCWILTGVFAAATEWECTATGLKPRFPESVTPGQLERNRSQGLPMPFHTHSDLVLDFVEQRLRFGRQWDNLGGVLQEVEEHRWVVVRDGIVVATPNIGLVAILRVRFGSKHMGFPNGIAVFWVPSHCVQSIATVMEQELMLRLLYITLQ